LVKGTEELRIARDVVELVEFGFQCDNYKRATYYLLGYELKKGNSPYDMFLDQNTEYVCDFNFI
jgi:hypothetical protein